MLTTTIAKAAAPNLPWRARTPGLAAILAQALRNKAAGGERRSKPHPVSFTWR